MTSTASSGQTDPRGKPSRVTIFTRKMRYGAQQVPIVVDTEDDVPDRPVKSYGPDMTRYFKSHGNNGVGMTEGLSSKAANNQANVNERSRLRREGLFEPHSLHTQLERIVTGEREPKESKLHYAAHGPSVGSMLMDSNGVDIPIGRPRRSSTGSTGSDSETDASAVQSSLFGGATGGLRSGHSEVSSGRLGAYLKERLGLEKEGGYADHLSREFAPSQTRSGTNTPGADPFGNPRHY